MQGIHIRALAFLKPVFRIAIWEWVCGFSVAVLSSNHFGSPRRCGGQGDVLSGW